MSDEIKLPTSVEEFQRARRLAFFAGAQYEARTDKFVNAAEAGRRRYPIRRKVPRKVWLNGALEPATFEPHPVTPSVKLPPGREYLGPEDVKLLADLLANPFEEVDE